VRDEGERLGEVALWFFSTLTCRLAFASSIILSVSMLIILLAWRPLSVAWRFARAEVSRISDDRRDSATGRSRDGNGRADGMCRRAEKERITSGQRGLQLRTQRQGGAMTVLVTSPHHASRRSNISINQSTTVRERTKLCHFDLYTRPYVWVCIWIYKSIIRVPGGHFLLRIHGWMLYKRGVNGTISRWSQVSPLPRHPRREQGERGRRRGRCRDSSLLVAWIMPNRTGNYRATNRRTPCAPFTAVTRDPRTRLEKTHERSGTYCNVLVFQDTSSRSRTIPQLADGGGGGDTDRTRWNAKFRRYVGARTTTPANSANTLLWIVRIDCSGSNDSRAIILLSKWQPARDKMPGSKMLKCFFCI